MPLELLTVPCLTDNYAFVVADPNVGEATVIDVPEAAPINSAVAARGWTVKTVLLTHHHGDHIAGLPDLKRAPDARVVGAQADAHRLPPLDQAVAEGDVISVCGEDGYVIDVSGHTVGHIAFHLPKSALVFTGDSLMAMGCGRLFEGTPPQMWASLLKLRALPSVTTVCSGHEYTAANARFAVTLDPGNPRLTSRIAAIDAARAKGVATVPSSLEEECATNPFLRADNPDFQKQLGMSGREAADVFAEIRGRKDKF